MIEKYMKLIINRLSAVDKKIYVFIILSIFSSLIFLFFINAVFNFISHSIDRIFKDGVNTKMDYSISLLTTFNHGLLISQAVIPLILLSVFAISFYRLYTNFRSLNKNQKGSSRFTTLKEIQEQYKRIPDKERRFEGGGGVPVARYKDELYIDDSSVNNLFVGTTRSGKGEVFVFQLIDILSRAKKQSSMVINDPKGELCSASKETLEELNYRVEILNLMNPNMSMSYDLLNLVKKEFFLKNYSQAQQYARSLSFMIYNDKRTSEQIWSKASTNLCTALILALCEVNKHEPKRITMYNLALMLTELSATMVTEDKDGLVAFFEQFPYNHPARMQFATYEGAMGATKASILMNTLAPLGIFMLESVGKMTSTNSLEMEKLGFNHWVTGKAKPLKQVQFYCNNKLMGSIKADDKGYFKFYHDTAFSFKDELTIICGKELKTTFKPLNLDDKEGNFEYSSDNDIITLTEWIQFEKPVAVFLIAPDYDETFNIISSLYIKQMYTSLSRAAANSSILKCFREVVFILEEFGNMAAIEGMSNMMTVCLGRNIKFNLIIQEYFQGKFLYGDTWKTIVENCGNTIYLLTTDKDTAEIISFNLGEKTITSKSRTGRTLSLRKTKTESIDSRRLLNATEVMSLKEGEVIILRTLKRQDLKGNRIKQYPIYLTGKTSMKYRWEYLSDFFDTSKSLNDIDIECSHAMLDLEDIRPNYDMSLVRPLANTIKVTDSLIMDEPTPAQETEDSAKEETETVWRVFGDKNIGIIEKHILPKYSHEDGSIREIHYFLNMEIYKFIDILKRLVISNMLDERIANIFIKAAKQKGYDV